MRVTFVGNVLLGPNGRPEPDDLQPHLGLIALIAALREAGHEATLYDPTLAIARGRTPLGRDFCAQTAERLAATDPDVVGFTSLGGNFVYTLHTARCVRERLPHAAIVLGGPHASILDRETLARCPHVDAIARGEADLTIAAFVDALGGRGALADVPGITYRSSGEVVRTADAGPVLDLDALPFPAYDVYPIAELGRDSLRVDAGRGCPFSCTFCSTASFFGRRYRLKSAQRLVAELRFLERRYGVRSFELSHDLFTVDARRVRAFCREVAPYGYRWRCSARMDCVDDALLGDMRAAGCDGIYYGIETGSPRMQRTVSKNLDLAIYEPRLDVTVGLGIPATVSFITGYPDESEPDQDETLALIGATIARHRAGVSVQLHVLTPEPGTALHARYAGTLAYDGYRSDAVVASAAVEDEALIRADPQLFVCYHHYAAGPDRAATIALAETYNVLRAVGTAFTNGLRDDGEPFAALLRSCAAAIVRDGRVSLDALAAFVAARRGEDHPLTDVARFVAAGAALRVDDAPPMDALEPDAPIRFAACARLVGRARDGEELFARLRAGRPLTSPPIAASHQLLVATPDLAGRRSIAIDAETEAIARALINPTTFDELARRFGKRNVERRFSLLCLLGAVVRAAPPRARATRRPLPLPCSR